jgi:transcriptional regulator with XRE-family HTH domain
MNLLQRRLDDARIELGLTFAQLAKRAGMTTGAAQYMISGPMRRWPKPGRLEGMSAATGIPMAELRALLGRVFGIYIYDRRGARFEIHVASSRPLTDAELAAVGERVDALEALLDDPAEHDQPATATG